MVDELTDSPFQPSSPVDPKKFKGRQDIITDIHKYMTHPPKGIVEHFYITGKRGMGKTSLTNYIIDYYERNHNSIGIHVVNDGINDIETLLKSIIEILINKNKNETWYQKLYDGIKNEIESIGILGNTVKFKPSTETIQTLRTHFAEFLKDLSDMTDKNFIIVIDDINGLSKTDSFANWYKSLADTLALNDYYGKTKVTFILTSYPEKLNTLYEHNPSFSRIFHHYELTELNDNEIKDFYIDNFNTYDVTLNQDSLNYMTYYCSGMPTMMQEIGDALFWMIPENREITYEIVQESVIIAGETIGRKYLQPVLDRKIRSEHYHNLFYKISQYTFEGHPTFTRKELETKFTDNEKKVFKDFIKRAKKLKIIESSDSNKQGEYQFTNKLYPLYFLIININNSYQQTLDTI